MGFESRGVFLRSLFSSQVFSHAHIYHVVRARAPFSGAGLVALVP